MNDRRPLVWITVAVLIVGALLAIRYANTGVRKSASHAPSVATLQQGQRAPEFSAATDRGYFDLNKTGKPVLLEVFATWCPHCQRETAVLDRIYEKYKNRLDVVGVSGSNTGMDGESPASEEDVLNFVRAHDVQYPVAYDGSLDVAHKYLQGGFPTFVLIDKHKKIAYVSAGEAPYSELSSAIERAL